MENNYKKTLRLFKLWCLSTYPERHVRDLIDEFENDYFEFKEIVDKFIDHVFEKNDEDVPLN